MSSVLCWIVPLILAVEDSPSLGQRAELHRNRGEQAEAERLLRRAAAAAEREKGAESADAAIAWHNVAVSLMDRGESARALPVLRRSVATLEHTLPARDLRLTFAKRSLAMAYLREGQYGEARDLLFAVRQSFEGRNHFETAATDVAWGELLLREGRPAEAYERLTAALKDLQRDEITRAYALQLLGASEFTLGDQRSAALHLGEALRLAEAQYGVGSQMLTPLLEDYKLVLSKLKRKGEEREVNARIKGLRASRERLPQAGR